VYVDAYTDGRVEVRAARPALARRVSDRHRGVGSDGLILVCRPRRRGHVRMRMFNADGSESEMCGNGVRCVAKFAHDRLGVRARPMRVETGAGTLAIDYTLRDGKVASATADMGAPILAWSRIPVDRGTLAWARGDLWAGLEAPNDTDGMWIGSFVSMGNPHAVFFDSENPVLRGRGLARLDVARIGPKIENHPAFPRRINAHFVVVKSKTEATMRTWERGAGATLACGTGACAVCVAGVRTGQLSRRVLLHLPGGDLRIHWDKRSNHVFMTGPAEDVFEGEWPG
jgi:diaminopimelate epimerase